MGNKLPAAVVDEPGWVECVWVVKVSGVVVDLVEVGHDEVALREGVTCNVAPL